MKSSLLTIGTFKQGSHRNWKTFQGFKSFSPTEVSINDLDINPKLGTRLETPPFPTAVAD